jgi:hypothetical protein
MILYKRGLIHILRVTSGFPGGVAEWLKAAVLKTAEAKVSGGSNPSSSARLKTE